MPLPPVIVSDITSGFHVIRPKETLHVPSQDRSALYFVEETSHKEGVTFWTSRTRSLLVKPGGLICFPMGAEHWMSLNTSLPIATGQLQPPFRGNNSDFSHESAKLFCSRIPTESNPMPDVLPSMIHLTKENLSSESDLDLVLTIFKNNVQRPTSTSDRILRRLAEIVAIVLMESVLTDEKLSGLNTIDGIGDPALRNAINAMHLRPEKDWSLKELADEAALSRTVFAERFRELLGHSPMKYLTRLRLAKARKLLKDTDRNIAQIAFDVGYNSEGSFRKAFKRLFETSPSEIRLKAFEL